MRYSASKYSVTLKTGLGIVQGHWKWCRLIDHTTFCWSATVSIVPFLSYLTLNDMTLKPGLEVTQGKLGCGFLFAFHSNYGSIWHYLRDKAIYWSKIVIFSYSLAFDAPVRGGGPCRNISIPFGMETRMVGLSDGEKTFEDIYNRLGIVRAMHTRRAVKTCHDTWCIFQIARNYQCKMLRLLGSQLHWWTSDVGKRQRNTSSAAAERPRDASCHWIFC